MVGLAFESKLVADVHHPVGEDGPHEPVEIFLSDFNVVGLDEVLFKPVFQPHYSLDFSRHVQLPFHQHEFPQLFFIVNSRCPVVFV